MIESMEQINNSQSYTDFSSQLTPSKPMSFKHCHLAIFVAHLAESRNLALSTFKIFDSQLAQLLGLH